VPPIPLSNRVKLPALVADRLLAGGDAEVQGDTFGSFGAHGWLVCGVLSEQ
jgi:hypothetical protein